MGWDEKARAVSDSFTLWKLTDSEIRSFWPFAMRVVSSEYERLWKQVGHEPYDFEWMLLAAMWKEAVTAYEVYVEVAFMKC